MEKVENIPNKLVFSKPRSYKNTNTTAVKKSQLKQRNCDFILESRA